MEKIKNWIFRKLLVGVGFKAKARKHIKSIEPDEDLYAYLLDLLQEDEKRLHTTMFCGDLDKEFNRELQEELKKLITKYGFSY